MSRATDRTRPGRVMVRSRANRQRKSRATRAAVDTVMRVRKLHVRHGTGKPVKISRPIRDETGKPMKMSRPVRDETGKPMKMSRPIRDKTSRLMKRIKTVNNNRIGKPIRIKRGIKSPGINSPNINNPMGPSKDVPTEKNSIQVKMARVQVPKEDAVTWPSIQPRILGGPKEENRVEVTLSRQLLLPIHSMTMYKSRKGLGTRLCIAPRAKATHSQGRNLHIKFILTFA